jgi:hypothetical protein
LKGFKRKKLNLQYDNKLPSYTDVKRIASKIERCTQV